MEIVTLVLPWIIIIFFIAIGIISLLAAIGKIKVQREFKKWYVLGFIASIVTAVLGLFNGITPSTKGNIVPIHIYLDTPSQTDSSIQFTTGKYITYTINRKNELVEKTGTIELTLGNDRKWMAKLNYQLNDKPIKLEILDRKNNTWITEPFYPNYLYHTINRDNIPNTIKTKSLKETTEHTSINAPSHFSTATPLYAKEVDIHNIIFNSHVSSSLDNRGKTLYTWTVYVDVSKRKLDNISKIEYILPPSYRRPFYVRNNPKTKFALELSGYESIQLIITIYFKDRSKKIYYYKLNGS
jgi:hypothetical protein